VSKKKKNIKVMHISYSNNIGGAAKAASRLHESLLEKIYSKFFYIKSNDNLVKKYSFTNKQKKIKIFYFLIRYIERFITKIFFFRSQSIHSLNLFNTFLPEFINSSNFDIIHLHWIGGNTLSIDDIAKINKPIVWTMHDMWPFLKTSHIYYKGINKNIKKNFIAKRIDNYIYRKKINCFSKNIKVIAPSNFIKKNVKNSRAFHKNDIYLLPNTLKSSFWKPLKKINKKNFTLGFGSLGHDQFHKGFDLLIKILDHLSDYDLKFDIIIFGDLNISIPDRLLKKFNITILGNLNNNELLNVYNRIDILLITSRCESFCQMASEAISCGTPVISFGIGGLLDIIENGKNGWLIKPFDILDYANKLKNLVESKYDLVMLSKYCRYSAVQRFDYKIISDKHIKMYKKVILDNKKLKFIQ
jgi:glycosyltransferase involved in cell wall biosynthesis